MRRIPAFASLALLAATTPLAAQTNPQCAQFLVDRARNVCDAAIDGAHLFTPVAGTLVSGGDPVLASAGGLGLGHFTFSLRGVATRVVVPDLDYSGIGRTVAADQKVTAPAPLVEAAVGILGGTGRGSNLSLDLLGSAQLLPTDQFDDIRVDDDAAHIGSIALGLGYGARLSLFGTGQLPSVSVSVMRRNIPRIDVGDVPGGDKFAFGTDLDVTNWRATIGREFSVLTLAAGAGWDSYSGRAEVSFRDPISDVPQTPIVIGLEDKRMILFGDVGFKFGPVLIGGEIGWQQGKSLGLGTTFEDNDPKSGRMFGGAGLRFVF